MRIYFLFSSYEQGSVLEKVTETTDIVPGVYEGMYVYCYCHIDTCFAATYRYSSMCDVIWLIMLSVMVLESPSSYLNPTDHS